VLNDPTKLHQIGTLLSNKHIQFGQRLKKDEENGILVSSAAQVSIHMLTTWFAAAYFTQGTVDDLGTVDDIRGVGDLTVPEGTFKSTRVNKSRHKNEDRNDPTKDGSSSRTYAPFPSPYPGAGQDSPEVQSIQMFQPYANYYNNYRESPPAEQNNDSTPYPPSQTAHTPHNSYHPMSYSPVSYNGYNHQNAPRYASTPSPRKDTHAAVVPSQSAPYNYVTTAVPDDRRSNTYPPSTPSSSHPHTAQWYSSQNYDSRHHHQHSNSHYIPSQAESAAPYASHIASESTTYQSPAPVRAASSLPSYSSVSGYSSSYIADGASVTLYDPHSPSTSHIPALSSSQTMDEIHESHLPPPVPIPLVPTTIVLDENPYIDDGSSSPTNSSRSGDIGPIRDLAPLHTLARTHPYRRDPLDDKTLRLLHPLPRQVSPAQ
jgi:Gti1/Pac2 family transcription factor